MTYHDPCYLGRHNRVFTPPREILAAIQGLSATEMPRCKERGFCCGAGGARMWMEEKIGKRINVERTDEALALDPDIISTACPYCITMLSDAVTAKIQSGEAREGIQVLDVSQILARSLKAPALVSASAPAPMKATPDATAGADNPQLGQEGNVSDGAEVTGTQAGDEPGGLSEDQGTGPPSAPEPVAAPEVPAPAPPAPPAPQVVDIDPARARRAALPVVSGRAPARKRHCDDPSCRL